MLFLLKRSVLLGEYLKSVKVRMRLWTEHVRVLIKSLNTESGFSICMSSNIRVCRSLPTESVSSSS